ncbi:MAG: EF-hand domain-containing protein [Planctomycetes bacterium]|nr:EF-hand domain-containing protein [Planctomycetota bacterium]
MKHILALALFLALACSPHMLWAAPPAPLTEPGELFTRLDRNGDGRIEASEIDPAHARLFRRLLTTADVDRDGALTRDELTAGLKDNRPERPLEQLPDPPSQEEIAKAVFRRLDGDRNGRLELKEIPKPQKKRYQELLKTADKDGNGSLDVKEFEGVYAQLMAEPPKVSPSEGKVSEGAAMLKRFMQLDTNSDGKIDQQEARGPLKNRFEKLDVDGNGMLDQEELKRAAERLAKAAAEPSPEGQKLNERLKNLQDKLEKKPGK